MKERPILFNADMVRAILAGRKTQTRRPITPQPEFVDEVDGISRIRTVASMNEIAQDAYKRWAVKHCPYGLPGDRLWVRETIEGSSVPGHVFYRADYASDSADDKAHGVFWRPSIHMPRWASRITLEITDVRVQRIQEISALDCLREGVGMPGDSRLEVWMQFKRLWNTVCGGADTNWDANPWVWAITFNTRALAGGDA